VTSGAAARPGPGEQARQGIPALPRLPPQVIGLRVTRESNDGYKEGASHTDAVAALDAVRAFMSVPGTYQITIYFME
jgi:hypothetical protein